MRSAGLRLLNRQLELKSQHDELTGLGNRRALRSFIEQLEAEPEILAGDNSPG